MPDLGERGEAIGFSHADIENHDVGAQRESRANRFGGRGSLADDFNVGVGQ